MRRTRATDPIRWVVALIIVGCALTAVIAPSAPTRPGGPVTVMTRNLYLGGDITRPVRAVQGLTGRDALLALGHANHQLRAVVDQTDFRVRSRLLAAEIAGARPDLVGLQEVALWRHGPMDLDHLGRPDATEVDDDFLALLQTQLAANAVPYDVVVAQPESDVEAPAFTGDPFRGTAGATRDVRLTISDVVLVRRDSAARVLRSGSGSYEHRLDLDLAGLPFRFVRGYAWADVEAGGVRFRFVTTHLESQSSAVALAQARELVDGATRTDQTVVVVCDCNSDPAGSQPSVGESVAQDAAYRMLTGSGLVDQWARPGTANGPGFTSGLGESLENADAAGFVRRLDLVLVRAAAGTEVGAGAGVVTGADPQERDPATGLWASDHAGVVMPLHLGGR